MIIGTAGHIDHGKTALVKALTGVDADRLPEEKARGITLDLGYAYAPLPDGQIVGFVDVPGHERLVHNMVAGATGIDFVLLVVAADDGPMPQTREHLQIVDLLGLSRGAVALTKVDAVDAARVDAAAGEVRAMLRGTALDGAPVFPVSGITGVGIAALRAHLEHAAGASPQRKTAGRFRLAVDRCFTLKGAGIIVTGTVHAGALQVGDEALLSPPGVAVRVRSIHAQDRPAPRACAGQRCALNLTGPGLEKSLVERGHWIVDPAAHAPVQRIDVQLRLLASERHVLRPSTPVHVHLGAIDITGRVTPLEADTLAPGAAGLVQLVLDRPIGALTGDRYLLRDQSASRTLGGGVVVDPFPPRRERRTPVRLQTLRTWAVLEPAPALRGACELAPAGVDLLRFAVAWNLPQDGVDAVERDVPMRTVAASNLRIGFSAENWQRLCDALVDALRAEHERAPDMIGVGRERLRRLAAPAVAPAACEAAIDELLAAGAIAVTGSWLHLPGHVVSLGPADEILWQRARPLLEAEPWQPPRVRDIAHALGIDETRVRLALKSVARLGEVYPVAHDHYFTRAAVGELARIILELDAEPHGASAATFRDRIGTGRKLAIHILEFFDRVGFTRRVGDRHLPRQPGMFAADRTPAPALADSVR